MIYWRPDAPSTTGPGHVCKVYQAQYGLPQQLVAVKIGPSAPREVGSLFRSSLALMLVFSSAQDGRDVPVGKLSPFL